ncbi:hypothetical protein ACLOJK_004933 [Asimina triloba]
METNMPSSPFFDSSTTASPWRSNSATAVTGQQPLWIWQPSVVLPIDSEQSMPKSSASPSKSSSHYCRRNPTMAAPFFGALIPLIQMGHTNPNDSIDCQQHSISPVCRPRMHN